MRVAKEAEERKQEILDAAERLFASKGFDNTSISNILEETGIARGTLYYHFKSKEELLDAVIERMIEGMTARAKEIADRRDTGTAEVYHDDNGFSRKQRCPGGNFITGA